VFYNNYNRGGKNLHAGGLLIQIEEAAEKVAIRSKEVGVWS